MHFRTTLGAVKGLGSAKDGVHHWWMQRVTAVALAPLVLWFMASLLKLGSSDVGAISAWLASPFNAILLLLFSGAMLYHGMLGMQVVIEDYVHTGWKKLFLLLFFKFLFWILGAMIVFSVFQLHTQGGQQLSDAGREPAKIESSSAAKAESKTPSKEKDQ